MLGWMAHPVVMHDDDNWIKEFMRRCRNDRAVLPKLIELNVVFEEEQSSSSSQSQSNNNTNAWYYLMREGEDIIDCVKSIILKHREIPDSTVDVVGEKVLNGISRCVAYQKWRYLHDAMVLPHTRVEDGAIAIAKLYDKHDSIMRDERIHSWEKFVLNELDHCADVVKQRLYNRSCALDVDSKYSILEVIEEMKYLFRNPDSKEDDRSVPPFRGNVDDYYNHTNSLINHCLVGKTGIPITLAVIYAAIVRRVCGVDMDIIGLPGHIVVGVPANGPYNTSRKFVDPFHQGRILSYADCRNIVARYNMTFNYDMIRPISNDQVWQRMVRNLIHCHSMQALNDDNDDDDSEATHEWKISIPLRFLLPDYANRITNFGALVAAPGWCPQFC